MAISLTDVEITEENERANQPLNDSQVNHVYENEDVIQPTRNEIIPSTYLTVPSSVSHYEQIPYMAYLTPAPNVQNQDPTESTELLTDYVTTISAGHKQNAKESIVPSTGYLTPIATANNKHAKQIIKPTTNYVCMRPIATGNNKHANQSTELTTDYLCMSPIATENNRHAKQSTEPTTDYLHMAPVTKTSNKHAKKSIEPTADYLTAIATAVSKKGNTEQPATGRLTPIAKMKGQNGNETVDKATKIQENEFDVRKQSRATDSQVYEYDDVEAPSKNEQSNSRYLTILEAEKPYDLPLAGYISPGTGVYTKLTKIPHSHDHK